MVEVMSPIHTYIENSQHRALDQFTKLSQCALSPANLENAGLLSTALNSSREFQMGNSKLGLEVL